MDRIEALKEEVPLDLWIVAMLYNGVSVTQVAAITGQTRKTVYAARDRVRQLLLMYNMLDISEGKE